MKTPNGIDRLKEGLPLYQDIDVPFGSNRIIGTETEYGFEETNPIPLPCFPGFVENGGRIYRDNAYHIEWCTPETKSPADASAFEKAGDLLCLRFAKRLFKNIVDTNNECWGAHESYSSTEKAEALIPELPFLITRQIMTGAGRHKSGSYALSQRSPFVNYVLNASAQKNARGIICIKDEKLSDLPRLFRIHLVLGDANRNPLTTFLKLGTTSLVLDLKEMGRAPKIRYDDKVAILDYRNIGSTTDLNRWFLDGTKDRMHAIEVQQIYCDAAKRELYKRDQQTRDIIDLWQDSLFKLEKNLNSLAGRLDWIKKREIIEAYARLHNIPSDKRLMSPDEMLILEGVDIEYHIVGGRDEELTFDSFKRQGDLESLFPEEIILKCTTTPPKSTRAFARSRAIKSLARVGKGLLERCYIDCFNDNGEYWSTCEIPSKTGEIRRINMGNPFDTYRKVVLAWEDFNKTNSPNSTFPFSPQPI
ncbi:MAG: proteasome accessory factor PafA2 family protein [Nanoarchaeota archaeon]